MEQMLWNWVDQQPSAVRDHLGAFGHFRDLLWHSIPKDDPDVSHDIECCENTVLVSDYYLNPNMQSLMPRHLEDNLERYMCNTQEDAEGLRDQKSVEEEIEMIKLPE